MNNLINFNNVEFGELRVLEINDKPYVIATDIAKSLGYSNPHKAINDHCKKVRKICTNDSLGRPQEIRDLLVISTSKEFERNLRYKDKSYFYVKGNEF